MKAIKHQVKHYYQPTNDSCGYTALAILLSHYGRTVTPSQLIKAIPQAKPDGEDGYGSITSQLAAWCLTQGFQVDLTTFDFLIIDLEWSKLKRVDEIIKRLEAVRDVREVTSLGKGWSKVYIEEYIKYLKAGGKLIIKPHPTIDLLYKNLAKAPIFVNVCSKPLYGNGRMRYPGVRKAVLDDVHGMVGTHSVVVYGNTEDGSFLLADPWDGLTKVTPEALLCAIVAAEIECDAMYFQILD